MLDYKSIRARYELAIRDALLPLSVPLHYDNVQEQPIPEQGSVEEYATITISFPSSTEPDICGGVVLIRGNVQVNMYAPRMGGMFRLEQMAAAVVCALMTISDYPDPDNVITHCGSIQGPVPVLGGQDPQATTVVSAPFTARVFVPEIEPEDWCGYVSCDCVDGIYYICGDIMDGAGVSICDYPDASLFPLGGNVEYDNADVIDPENLNVPCP